MGSLMAGWDSRIMDEHTARVRRNKSLTKEEINAFWRSKSQRKDNERDMNFSPSGSPVGTPEFLNDDEKRRAATPFSRSHNDVWSIATQTTNQSSDEITNNSNTSGDWWTRSSGAFLNEPPRDEKHVAHKYTAQFHIAQMHN
ncbi:hypothetical protein LUZ61_007487 [Rhynchospora tenuis]|uniref:Uncharacterized protein n=1 Tax=Rhynchospora tenuis TaxID=198213 RepID=A0AAD6EWH6_9POAL|nr:hypothetical protein LUZ61_007487 [Rhynchospora tenuis]